MFLCILFFLCGIGLTVLILNQTGALISSEECVKIIENEVLDALVSYLETDCFFYEEVLKNDNEDILNNYYHLRYATVLILLDALLKEKIERKQIESVVTNESEV